MRIRFVTKDNLKVVRECRDIKVPPVAIVRPILDEGGKPVDIRRYEYRGEIINRIPTLNEV
jgi:hypothetical protein